MSRNGRKWVLLETIAPGLLRILAGLGLLFLGSFVSLKIIFLLHDARFILLLLLTLTASGLTIFSGVRSIKTSLAVLAREV